MPPSRWASFDYALDWPRELLAQELEALEADPYWHWQPEHVSGLLREAFHGPDPAQAFDRASSLDVWFLDATPPDGSPQPEPNGRLWIRDLLEHMSDLRDYSPPMPLWRARTRGAPADDGAPDDVRQTIAELLHQLASTGYFAKRFPENCVDDGLDEYGDPPHDGTAGNRIRRYLAQATGHEGRDVELWPVLSGWGFWPDDTFYEVIEALHDVAARPRHRWFHEDRECGLHFEEFDTDAGRRIYRALVNRVLVKYEIDLRLADSGEDEGRLVRTVDDARAGLIAQALAAPTGGGGDRVKHAIALFRRRSATPEDKRLAAVALFGVLEERSQLVKATPHITSKDEDDLYNIANNFALRHQDVKQKRHYDPIFLDWIFWWFLSAIEVTNQVLARGSAPGLASNP